MIFQSIQCSAIYIYRYLPCPLAAGPGAAPPLAGAAGTRPPAIIDLAASGWSVRIG